MTTFRVSLRPALAFIAALACAPAFLVHASSDEPVAPAPSLAAVKAFASPSGQALNVLAATFSFGADFADVTGRVRELLRSDASFRVNPESLLVDPHPNGSKVLVIVCEIDGRRAIFSAGEGEDVSRALLRQKAKIIPDPLKILAASYSFGSDYADVTARVRDLLRSDATFQANPECLRVDPHPYWNKALIIFCEVDGKRAIFSVGENENVSRALLLESARFVPAEPAAFY